MPLVKTRGAASAQGFGEFAQASAVNYIEDVFSCFLYTGNGSTQTITNGIDLAGKGGLVWIKSRSSAVNHVLQDSARGADNVLYSNSTSAEFSSLGSGFTFNSTGFATGSFGYINTSSATYASWTFRKQPKFFDVVTYTGNGAARTITHNLGSVPGCIIVKCTTDFGNWWTWHRGLTDPTTGYLILDTTDAEGSANLFGSTLPTSTVFSLGAGASSNSNGQTYVAYLFAHDAGGFGLTGTDNVISCGSFTSDGAGFATVNLGYEPQWVLWKISSQAGYGWVLADNMRGLPVPSSGAGDAASLFANTSAAETDNGRVIPNATGFTINSFGANSTHIYIAIRRGPMKVPTLGTSVFKALTYTGTGFTKQILTGVGFPPDMFWPLCRTSSQSQFRTDKLRGPYAFFDFSNSPESVQTSSDAEVQSYNQDGVTVYWNGNTNGTGEGYVGEFFRRAPGFFDEVCYTGTGANQTVAHNLGAVPELIIAKDRTTAYGWPVSFNFTSTNQGYAFLNDTTTFGNDIYFNVGLMTAQPTASNMFLVSSATMNGSGDKYVAYLFATCAGVSKVFSYTGNGSSQTINCGFTAGSRWVMIKRTDAAGDWYVWDSARGIVAGNDPHLSLNSTAAEVTTDDSVDTDNTGFIVNQVAATNVNVTSATYIGLAIA